MRVAEPRLASRVALLAVVLSVLAAGCAEYTPGLRPTDPYSDKSAYVYGRFFVDAESATLALDGHQSMGFAIRCRDGNRYVLRFSNQSSLQIIRVAPSVCQMVEIIYTDAAGNTLGRKVAPFRLFEKEILDPGGVYYVGDFFARATKKSNLSGLRWETHWNWSMTGITDNYDKTTDQLKRYFPHLASAATENRMTHGPDVE